MKLTIFKWTGLLVFLLTANHVFARTSQLYELYLKRDFISLEYQLNDKQLKKKEAHAYEVFNAFLLNAYGKHSQAREILHKSSIGLQNDTLSFLALKTLSDIEFHKFNYSESSRIGKILLEKYKDMYPPQEYQELYQFVKIATILQDAPAQEIIKTGNTSLDLKKDAADLLNIPVSMENTALSLVFDSGAGMSVIAESVAKKLNLNTLSDSTVQIPGSAGITTTAKLALAKSIQIGNISVSNVAFLVFPDSALSFAGGSYKMDGIIGFPVIKEFGSLTFIKQNQLFVPQKIAKSKIKPNMILDELQPILILTYNSNDDIRLPFTFDTGASKSTISKNFYQRFPYDVETKGKENKRTFEGVGGKKEFEGFDIDHVNFRVSNKTLKLNNVFVFKEPFLPNGEGYYGNIGQDAIQQFERVTINFKHSFIKFSKPI
jgi:predicted aspartyl protease